MSRWKRVLLWGLAGILVLLLWSGLDLRPWPRATGASAGSDQGPTTSETLVRPVPATSMADVDVVVYGTQTSGIAAVREITRTDPELRVAIISSGDYLESPLAQGLSVEDARNVDEVAGGVYSEWRRAVMTHYRGLGVNPFTDSGRFVYEPKVASDCLWSLIEGSTPGQVLFYAGTLLAASDNDEARYVDLRLASGTSIRVHTRYFIDASVEADLSRMLGASYRVGRSEDVYNDREGPVPAFPSQANGFATAPQRFSVLLTLRIYAGGEAPRHLPAAGPQLGLADATAVQLSPKAVQAFARCWTMNTATLPGDCRELNETWNDYPDQPAAFQWIFEPDKRAELATLAARRSLDLVAYLQERGYAAVGVDSVPQYPYIREGPRVVGLTTYTMPHIVAGARDEVVAVGCYTLYDRHDIFKPNQLDKTTWVQVPMQALVVAGHPSLLVSTAISTSYRAYSSPVRTELTRANLGGAAGVIVTLAARMAIEPSQVPYTLVRALLRERGYQIP